MKLAWHPRFQPLEPRGIWSRGADARCLALRLLERPLNDLRGCTSGDQLVLLGPPEQLGWVEGAVYLGLEPGAPLLYVPTLWAPSLPAEWICSRLARLVPPPWLMLPTPLQVLSLAGLSAVEPPSLARFAGVAG